MNDHSETLAVAALNKIDRNYGRAGLLQALRAGGEGARGMAMHRLVNYPGADVEQALRLELNKTGDIAVPLNALAALKEIGTEESLAAVARFKNDPRESVAKYATDAEAAVQARMQPASRAKN